jgi:hypothetical protein
MVKMERKKISSWNGFLVLVLMAVFVATSKTIPIYATTATPMKNMDTISKIVQPFIVKTA